jgi:hypothetical protein
VSDLALDAAGDLLIEHGDAVLATGALAVAQDWQRRLGLFKGEWSLDRRVGIDYQGLIFDGRPSQALLRHVFETVTRETAGVKSLDQLSFTFERGSRTLDVNADVTIDSGESVALTFRNVLFPEADA